MTAGARANLAAVIEARAEERGWAGDAAFLVRGRTYSHGQVHQGAARAATLLGELGVAPGERVLLALPDGVEFAWAFLGAVRAGAIAIPVNPRLTEADHRNLAADADPKAVVCTAELAGRFAGRAVVPSEGLEAVLEAYSPRPPVEVGLGGGAYAQYTSGTTGPPKAALHAHGHPFVYFEAFARQAIAMGRDDVVLSVSKLYFAYGLGNSLFFPLLAGCRAVLHPGPPRAGDVAALARRHSVSVLFSVPTFYAHLVAGGDPGAWSSLRVAVSAGEALGVPLAERARNFLGCPVLDGVGSTEVGQTFASNTVEQWRDGTVGRALPPYRVSVRDARGRQVDPGHLGSLWVAGPTLLLEYLGQPAATAAVRRGEWLCTGDRAVVDADGFVSLRGRSDDMEMVGGICVSPLEVEAVLARHPAVVEVAVAGVVGPGGGSRLEAFVVADAGAHGAEALSAELMALARAELSPFKVPRSVAFVEALPRTPTGKLRRFVLRSGAWGPAAQSPATTRAPKRSR